MPGRIDARLKDLGIRLPEAAAAAANYVPYRVVPAAFVSGQGKPGETAHVYVAGQGPFFEGRLVYNGRLGDSLTLAEGKACARIVGLNVVAQARAACGGDLDRVVRCVRLGGFVNCAPDFTDIPKVIDGASELMVEIFGEAGRHARVAVGMPVLPFATSVEIDAIFEIM
jgi:enamine deaminase RidA (YjgF/YER057c/UK114 family)